MLHIGPKARCYMPIIETKMNAVNNSYQNNQITIDTHINQCSFTEKQRLLLSQQYTTAVSGPLPSAYQFNMFVRTSCTGFLHGREEPRHEANALATPPFIICQVSCWPLV